MIKVLEEFLITNTPARKVAISDIEDSCIASTLEVFNFDVIKDFFSSTIRIEKPKSCDCIFLKEVTNELFFIEIKDFEKLKEFHKSKYPDFNSFRKSIEEKFNRFQFENKIIDSIIILLSLMGYFNISKDFYSYFLQKCQIGIHFIIALNISYEDLLTYDINNLAYIERINKLRFLKEFSIIRTQDLDILRKNQY